MIGWINEIRYFRAHYVAMLVSPPLKTKGTARTRTRKHSRTSGSVLYERYLGKLRFFYTYFLLLKSVHVRRNEISAKSRNLWKMFLRLVLHFYKLSVYILLSPLGYLNSSPYLFLPIRAHTLSSRVLFSTFLKTFFQKSRATSDVSRSIVVSEWLFLQYVIAANKKILKHVCNWIVVKNCQCGTISESIVCFFAEMTQSNHRSFPAKNAKTFEILQPTPVQILGPSSI